MEWYDNDPENSNNSIANIVLEQLGGFISFS